MSSEARRAGDRYGSLTTLDGWFLWSKWPDVTCPACGRPNLVPDEKPILVPVPDAERVDHPAWDPTFIRGSFHGVLRCPRADCLEPVSVTGEYGVDAVAGDSSNYDSCWDEFFQLRFAIPAILIMQIPSPAPAEVKARIAEASTVIWADPNAAANRLRLGIEDLLTARRIPQTNLKGGKRTRLTTHARIERLKHAHPVAGEALEAVKWIGNQGAHESRLSITDVLEGAELFEYALRLLYDKRDIEIVRRVREINRAKGISRQRRPR